MSYSSLSLHFIIKSREVSKARANVAEIVAVRINTYTTHKTENKRERARETRQTNDTRRRGDQHTDKWGRRRSERKKKRRHIEVKGKRGVRQKEKCRSDGDVGTLK